MRRIHAAVWVSISLFLFTCSVTLVSTAGAVDLSPEDMLAATLRPEEIRQAFPNPGSWWPSFPEFNTGRVDKKPGERIFVAQAYRQVGQDPGCEIENTLILFDDEKLASQALKSFVDADAVDNKLISGPALGDESQYFSRTATADGQPFTTTVRYRVKAIIGYLAIYGQMGGAKPEELAGYAAPLVRKAEALQDGTLKANPLPDDLAKRLPPEIDKVRPIIGSAPAPIDSWALNDIGNDPQEAREKLLALGAGDLGLRRFGLSADPTQVVEAVLFTFPGETAAAEWVQDFLDDKDAGKQLDAGKTGMFSMFIRRSPPAGNSNGGDIYELQFARGRFVGDVACFSPFGKTSRACKEAALEMAEAWFCELGKN